MFSARPRRHASRVAALATTTVLATGTLAALAAPVYAVAPKVTTKLPVAIERLSPYQPQTTCAPVARPGVIKFRALILATYQGTGDSGIVRACSVGGRSEHKEGRAWDWRVSVKSPTQVRQVNALFAWLFATDAHGNRYAMARRLGIMYIIWNKQIWGTWSQKWEPYACSGETGCHQNHVHFSFDWSGALKKTSFWTGVVSQPMDTPHPLYTSLTTKQIVKVPATSNGVTTWFAVKAGMKYRLTVTGAYHYRQVTADAADAECSASATDPTWHALAPGETSSATGLRDLVVNATLSGWRAAVATGGGCNTATHAYTMTIAPATSAPLQFAINDPGRTDDSGVLTVTVARVV